LGSASAESQVQAHAGEQSQQPGEDTASAECQVQAKVAEQSEQCSRLEYEQNLGSASAESQVQAQFAEQTPLETHDADDHGGQMLSWADTAHSADERASENEQDAADEAAVDEAAETAAGADVAIEAAAKKATCSDAGGGTGAGMHLNKQQPRRRRRALRTELRQAESEQPLLDELLLLRESERFQRMQRLTPERKRKVLLLMGYLPPIG
jgi:hypothetical protein